jgi:hypothetical protein
MRFLFSEIENIYEQNLLIVVFDSDRDQVPGVKTVVQQKRGVSQLVDLIENKRFYSIILAQFAVFEFYSKQVKLTMIFSVK